MSAGKYLDKTGCLVDTPVAFYIAAARLSDVLWEQFEFLMDAGADPENATKSELGRMAEISAILLDPFHETCQPTKTKKKK